MDLNSVRKIKGSMIDAGVTWFISRNDECLSVIATGPDRSGAIILMNIPDDVVLRRAWRIIVNRIKRMVTPNIEVEPRR